MRMIIRYFRFFLISLLLIIAFNDSKAQQDPLYSQYIFNQMTVNPAYVGAYNMFSANTLTRYQWINNVKGAPKTYMFTAQSTVINNQLGIGVMLQNDRIGARSNTEFHGMYAYKVPVSATGDITFGLQTGLLNYTTNFDRLNHQPGEDDQAFIKGNQSVLRPNFGTGMMFMNDFMYAGFSIPKIINSEFKAQGTNITHLRRHYYLSAGTMMEISRGVSLKPSFLYRILPNSPNSLDINFSSLILDKVWAGISFRTSKPSGGVKSPLKKFSTVFNAISLMSQFEIYNRVRLGYAAGLPPIELIDANYLGSHELFLNIDVELFDYHDIDFKYF